ncbi:MAG: hypothetical protein JW828_09280 [Sedimentisphaerales bacterium]|nr:hypothetical protein [Sedimentisphaerales bacterium]
MKRKIRTALYIVVCIFLTCQFSCQPLQQTSHHDDYVLIVTADELQKTIVSPHTEININPNTNTLWCSTFQLAWNEACDLLGEDLHFIDEPSMVGILNKHKASKKDIDVDSYIALAGHIKDGILDRIQNELDHKFNEHAPPDLIPSEEGLRPQDIVTYSYLLKNMSFPEKFELLESPLYFEGTPVTSFGIGNTPKAGHFEMSRQVIIHDYQSEDDFIVEIKVKDDADQIILAKTQPKGTLKETIDAVMKRIEKSDSAVMLPCDVLKVPKMNFKIHRKYNELQYKKLVVKNPDIAHDLFVLSADQTIRFQMDEKGVKLQSESSMTFGCSASYNPPPQHIMIFDKPFLVLLKRKTASQPYYALWTANPEILIPYK